MFGSCNSDKATITGTKGLNRSLFGMRTTIIFKVLRPYAVRQTQYGPTASGQRREWVNGHRQRGLIGGITRGDGGRRGDNMRSDMTSAHIWTFPDAVAPFHTQFPVGILAVSEGVHYSPLSCGRRNLRVAKTSSRASLTSVIGVHMTVEKVGYGKKKLAARQMADGSS